MQKQPKNSGKKLIPPPADPGSNTIVKTLKKFWENEKGNNKYYDAFGDSFHQQALCALKVHCGSHANVRKVKNLLLKEGDESVEVLIEGKPFRMIADQGASISCLNEEEAREKCPEALTRKNLQRNSENKFLKLADNSRVKSPASYFLNLQIGGRKLKTAFALYKGDNLLGRTFLKQASADVSVREDPPKLLFFPKKFGEAHNIHPFTLDESESIWADFQIRQPKLWGRKDLIAKSKDTHVKYLLPSIVDSDKDGIVKIYVRNLGGTGVEFLEQELVIDINVTEGFKVTPYSEEKVAGIIDKYGLERFENSCMSTGSAPKEFLNFYEYDDLFHKISRISEENNSDQENITECYDPTGSKFCSNNDENSEGWDFEFDSNGNAVPAFNHGYDEGEIDSALSDLGDGEVKNSIRRALTSRQVISTHSYDCGLTKDELDIPVKKDYVPNKVVYPLSPSDAAHLKSILSYLMAYEIIQRQPYSASGGSPCFLVPREAGKASRLVIDLRRANKFIDCETSCSMSSTYQSLYTACESPRWVTMLDLRQCYLAIKLSKATMDTGISDIVTSFGNFRFCRGLTGVNLAPSFLSAHIKDYLSRNTMGELDILSGGIVAFYDDILAFSSKNETLEEHARVVVSLISRIFRAGYKINLQKSRFCVDLEKETVKVLGFNLSYKGLSIPPEKKKAIMEIPIPKSVKQVQKFLGSLVYFRALLGLESLNSMNVLSRAIKKTKLEWGEYENSHFQRIKDNLLELDLYQSFPEAESIYIITSDASSFCLGGCCFSFHPRALNLENKKLDIPCYPLESNLKDHAARYNVMLEQYSETGEPLINIFVKFVKVFDLSGGKSENNVLKELKEACYSLAGSFMFKLPYMDTQPEGGVNEKRCKAFNVLARKLEAAQIEYNEPNIDELLLQGISLFTQRQVWLIIIGSKQKRDFIQIGQKTFRTPIILGFLLKTGNYLWLGVSSEIDNYPPTREKQIENLSNEEIYSQFIKLSKSKVFNPNIKLIGFYSKSLTISERSQEGYVLEAMALIKTLEYFSKTICYNKCIVVTDNEPSSFLLPGEKQSTNINKKFAKWGRSLRMNFPKLAIIYAKGEEMIADFLTRASMEPYKKVLFCDYNDEGPSLADINNGKGYFTTDEYVNSTISPFHNPDKLREVGETHCRSVREEKKESPMRVHLVRECEIDKIFLGFFSPLKIKALQNEDESIQRLLTNDNPSVSEIDGVTYRNKKMVLPEKLYGILAAYVHRIFMHGSILNDYNSAIDLYAILNKTKLKELIEALHSSCGGCISGKRLTHKDMWGAAFSEICCRRNALVYCDLLERGQEVKSVKSTRFCTAILFIKDVFSGYISCYFLRDKTAKGVCLSFQSYIAAQGCPKFLVSDNGACFGRDFIDLCERFGIKKLRSSPNISRVRGQIETLIGRIREKVRCQAGLELTGKTDFTDYVPSAVRVINYIKSPKTNLSPHDIFIGPEQALLYDKKDQLFLRDTDRDNAKIETLLQEIKENIYKESVQGYKEHLAKINRNRKKGRIKEGDIVVVRDHRREGERKNLPLFSKKFYYVAYTNNTTANIIDMLTKVNIKRHLSQLKVINVNNFDKLHFSEDMRKQLGLLTVEDIEFSLFDLSDPIENGVGQIMTRSKCREREIEEENDMDISKLFEHNRVHFEDDKN